MKVLLDESVPRIVQKRLPQIAMRTVQEMGWAGLKNGELLKKAESHFEVFVTADKNLRYQQNLLDRKLAAMLLPSNRIPDVLGLLPEIERLLKTMQPGAYVEVLK